jgi:trans-aconitate 2-methyltransferase
LSHEWDAPTYDRVSDPQVRWALPVLERLNPDGLHTALDAGCGSGRVTEMLLERFPDTTVVAIDASAAMVGEAGKRLQRFGRRVTLVRADLSRPLSGIETVDAVFSTAAFHWITDHSALFRNLAAVLRSGGQLVAQWGGGRNIANVVEVLREVGDGWPGPWHFATVDDTESDLRSAGFTDLNVWTHDDPVDFDSSEAFEDFLKTVILGAHLERIGPDERDAFVRSVADRLPGRRVDYVRLNATARRV